MLPHIVLICSNSRLRRLYQTSLSSVECEITPCKSVAEALVQIIVSHPSIIVIVESVPIFDLSILLDILAQHADWKELPVIAVGFTSNRTLFPPSTHHVIDENQFVRILKELIATL